jgi:hypothetical protein
LVNKQRTKPNKNGKTRKLVGFESSRKMFQSKYIYQKAGKSGW